MLCDQMALSLDVRIAASRIVAPVFLSVWRAQRRSRGSRQLIRWQSILSRHWLSKRQMCFIVRAHPPIPIHSFFLLENKCTALIVVYLHLPTLPGCCFFPFLSPHDDTVLLSFAAVQCFGENGHGELGIGSTDNVGDMLTDMGENLTAVDLSGTASDMAAGGSSSCAVLVDDSIKCW